jgi:hypothetical protein
MKVINPPAEPINVIIIICDHLHRYQLRKSS